PKAMRKWIVDHRWRRWRAIRRKIGILRRIGGNEHVQAWAHGATGRFAKGKIHCACPMCKTKSCDSLSGTDTRKIADAQNQFNGLSRIQENL
ncbi:MAG: hypothetical protein RR296_13425, partial [Clostridia bacterium]